jgi:hypothetical protein
MRVHTCVCMRACVRGVRVCACVVCVGGKMGGQCPATHLAPDVGGEGAAAVAKIANGPPHQGVRLRPATSEVKFTGLAQNLGCLDDSNRDSQSSPVNFQVLSRWSARRVAGEATIGRGPAVCVLEIL